MEQEKNEQEYNLETDKKEEDLSKEALQELSRNENMSPETLVKSEKKPEIKESLDEDSTNGIEDNHDFDDEYEDDEDYEDEDWDDEDEEEQAEQAPVAPSAQIIKVEDLSEEDQARYKELQGQIQALLAKNRTSNYLLLLLIVAYVFCLFFANSWYLLVLIVIPMVGLLIWDHRILKRIRAIQAQMRQMGVLSGAVSTKEVKTLNELPKDYTVLDDVILNERPVDHVILSPFGIFYVSNENMNEKVASELNLSENEVHFIDESLPLDKQIEEILSQQTITIPEPELMKMAYKLMGIEK